MASNQKEMNVMVIYRNNAARTAASTPEARLAAVERHHARVTQTVASSVGSMAERATNEPDTADIIYGARAIARFIFGVDNNRARRRVFNLWTHYRDRQERAGFFKLKGALCLSKSQWRSFHGL
jgi:hypothetical protein